KSPAASTASTRATAIGSPERCATSSSRARLPITSSRSATAPRSSSAARRADSTSSRARRSSCTGPSLAGRRSRSSSQWHGSTTRASKFPPPLRRGGMYSAGLSTMAERRRSSLLHRPQFRFACLAGPGAVFIVVALLLPLLSIVVFSFWRTESYELYADWNLDNYRALLGEPAYRTFFL